MGQFIKFIFATIIGLFLFLLILGLIFGVSVIGMSKKDKAVKVKPNSIMKVKLNYEVAERSDNDPFSNFSPLSMESNSKAGLNDLMDGIKRAKKDDNIKGMLLELSSLSAGLATTEELRNAMIDFKKSGKFIVAYTEAMTQKAYYLASIADKIYLNPQGLVAVQGYSTELTFMKNAIDRLEVEPVIFYAGNFKSATEPIRYTKMSEYNRLQYRELLGDFYDDYISKVAPERGMTKDELHQIIDQLVVTDAEAAKTNKLVDDLLYVDQVNDILREKVGLDEEDKLNFVSLRKYANGSNKDKSKKGKDKIALLYAEGSITGGKGEGGIGSDTYVKAIQKIREDKDVKAIVLRINSGGGSALASDIIWRELQLARKQGIPVITSMGDVAASGGYYIPAISDTIVAHPNTITGSIGVFALMANAGKFFEDKVGFTFDTVKTTQHSDFPMGGVFNRPLTDMESQIFQKSVDDIYNVFLQRVADGRSMDTAAVHEIAQGRVWTGKQAKANGLVDVLGGINDALAIAAKKADLGDEYKIAEYPKKMDPFEKILKQLTGQAKTNALKKELGQHYKYYKMLKDFTELEGVQMRVPFELEVR